MNWAFLLVALVGGVFTLAMIAWVMFLAPAGDRAADLAHERRRIALGGALRRVLGPVVLGVRRLAASRTARRAQ